MKRGNMTLAFLLNLFFAVLEAVGGLLTGSVAILSDALHDLGDAAGIGVSLWLEKKSGRAANGEYTFGYSRFSVLGGLFTTGVLLAGSVAVIAGAVERLLHPVPIHYNGMLLLAIVGVAVNLAAALLTRGGDSVNQRAVNLHMLEDVLGWVVVLIGAAVMGFTDLVWLDPALSMAVALYILWHAIGNLKDILPLLLEKAPSAQLTQQARQAMLEVDGVEAVHHIHLWQLDEHTLCLTAHLTAPESAKPQVRQALAGLGITHTTLETGADPVPCTLAARVCRGHCHHHHHHH